MVCKPKTRVSIADPGRNSVMLEEWLRCTSLTDERSYFGRERD